MQRSGLWKFERADGGHPALRDSHGSGGGFSLIELLAGLTILIVLGLIFSAFLSAVIQGGKREGARSLSVNSARSALDMVSSLMRTGFIQFGNYPGLPLGVNFDLDDDREPVVRDGMFFFVDRNRTAVLYPNDEADQPQTAGFDDVDGDGQPDLIGFGLVAQDDDGDQQQDFVDNNFDGKPDDLNEDGQADLLWRFVMVPFSRPQQVMDVGAWKAGMTLAANAFIQLEGNGRNLKNAAAQDIDLFQYFSRDAAVMSGDKDGDGELNEKELGGLVTGGGIIDHVTEVAAIDGIRVNLHVAAVRRGQRDRLSIQESVSGRVIPRAITLFRRNGIVGLADPTVQRNIDESSH